MRALLGGVVGSVVAGAAWLAAEHFTQSNLFWLVAFVGLVTGLSIHRAAGSSARGGTTRGALALALTLAVIVGGRQIYAKFMQSITDPSALVAQTIAQETEIPEEDPDDESDGADAAADVTPSVTVDKLPTEIRPLERNLASTKPKFSEWDMIWMSIAALTAYISAKGGEKMLVAEGDNQPPEDSTERPDAPLEDE